MLQYSLRERGGEGEEVTLLRFCTCTESVNSGQFPVQSKLKWLIQVLEIQQVTLCAT